MRLMVACTFLFLATPIIQCSAQQGNFIPGSGVELENVGDDFEDPAWTYIYNNPKSTEENNEKQNQPIGKSANGRWFEGVKRGQPDLVQRVETPPGGLPGSTGAMLLKSLHTGIPDQPSFKMQQEDFIMNVQYRNGGPIGVSSNPSVTTRVFLPSTDRWERRSGPHFAFRIALETTKTTPGKFLGITSKKENEVYWPGLFICMDTKEQSKSGEDRVYFRVRSNAQGGDMMGPPITTTGWWTLGLSISSNGAVHYYAKPGIEDLTAEDYITTQYPYGYKAERFRSAFFNVINGDNGRDWSTTWIIDDTKVYLGTTPNRSQMASSGRPTLTARQSAPQSAPPSSQKAAGSTPPKNAARQPTSGQTSSSQTQPGPSKASPKTNNTPDFDYYR